MRTLQFSIVTAHEGLQALGYDLSKACRGRIIHKMGMCGMKTYSFRYRLRDRKIITHWAVDQAHICRDGQTGKIISVYFDKAYVQPKALREAEEASSRLPVTFTEPPTTSELISLEEIGMAEALRRCTGAVEVTYDDGRGNITVAGKK